jgi:hypothetical protein
LQTFVCGPQFWATFFHSQGYALIFDKNVLGYVLGDIFRKTHLVTLVQTEAVCTIQKKKNTSKRKAFLNANEEPN